MLLATGKAQRFPIHAAIHLAIATPRSEADAGADFVLAGERAGRQRQEQRPELDRAGGDRLMIIARPIYLRARGG